MTIGTSLASLGTETARRIGEASLRPRRAPSMALPELRSSLE
jgi:hypothetical protein